MAAWARMELRFMQTVGRVCEASEEVVVGSFGMLEIVFTVLFVLDI